jgi:ribonuclease R
MDSGGMVEAINALQRNVAHRLIEEFMLLANETVASYLDAQGSPALYRIHEEPDILKVAKFEDFISGFGYSLGVPLTALRPRHFQKLIERIQGKPEEKPIAFLMLRTMQKARYAPENLGHFGLAASSYTHFTSPIRRYPDLVVHRALRAARHGALTEERREEWTEDLPEIARHTSEMERRAAEAERELLQWKKVKFMADKVGDEFEGYVTGRRGVRLVRRAHRALRRRTGPRLDDGRRLLPVRRERALSARREYAEGVPARRQGEGAGRPRQHGGAADRSGPGRDPRSRARGRARAAPLQGPAEARAAPREGPPGKRERGMRKRGKR